MKSKLFALTIVAFTISANLFGQSFGVKAGLNYFTLTGDFTDATYKPSLHAGLFLDYRLSKKIDLVAELLYSSQGAVDKDDNDYKTRLDYIAVPIMLAPHLTKEFTLQIGLQPSFLVSAKSITPKLEVDIKDDLKSLDFGFVLGANYYFTDKLSGNFRFVQGITNISDNSDFDGGNRGFQFSVGYRFSDGK